MHEWVLLNVRGWRRRRKEEEFMFAESTKTLNPKPVSLFALVLVWFVGLFLFVFWWRRRRGKGMCKRHVPDWGALCCNIMTCIKCGFIPEFATNMMGGSST
jgi:hypothetical protein